MPSEELTKARELREEVLAYRPKGFILSGGPLSVYEAGAPTLLDYVLDSGVPVFGICYGMQLLTQQLGGRVNPSQQREYGHPGATHTRSFRRSGHPPFGGCGRGCDDRRLRRRLPIPRGSPTVGSPGAERGG